MKKLLILMMVILMPMALQAKEYELYCSIGDVSTGGPFFEDDSVRFEFEWHSFAPHFLKVRIKNKTQSRITVEWENARLCQTPICFRSDNIFTFNNQKPDEVVHAKSTSEKEIGEREDPDYMSPLFFDSSIKDHGESVSSVIIPIKFPSGKIIDYKVFVCLKYKD